MKLIATRWLPAFFALFASLVSAQKPACHPTVTGDLRVESFHSKTFDDTQTLRIWLPPGYGDAAAQQRQYPVLLLLDGQNLFDVCTASFGHEWQIDEALTRLIHDGSIEPLIVVGIDNAGSHRADQYLPYADPVFGNGADEPHGRQFPQFLATEVLPRIRSEYRIENGAAHTAIGGSSYGAVAALYALITRPDVFGIGLLESPSLQAGNGRLVRDAEDLVEGPRRVSVGIGDAELGPHSEGAAKLGTTSEDFNRGFVHMAETLAANLKTAGMNHPQVLFTVGPGAHHEEQAWAARFPAAIQFLFPRQP